MPSLTRAEAGERAGLIFVEHYDVHLDLTLPGPDFRCEVSIRFGCARPGAASFLDVQPTRLESVELNGRQLDPAALVDGRLPLAGLAERNELRVRALMSYSTDGEGLHRHVDPADGRTYLYAMSFLNAAPRWFACFDQPDLKARYDFDVRCPTDWSVWGNGPTDRRGPGHWQISSTAPLATYFVTLVAGPYHSAYRQHDGIELGVHARESLASVLRDQCGELLDLTARAFDRLHELFGVRYPFGDYQQCFVPDFNAGAMENPGCVTLRDQLLFRGRASQSERTRRAGTVVHELAHMWFGDLVTMRWWDDLWLNESFAEYIGHRVLAEISDHPSWLEFGVHRKPWGFAADQYPSTHPVAGNGSADAASALADFDGISYAKGSAVLRQLATHLGDAVFFSGLRRHFAEHRFGNADLGELLASWTAAGAVDLAAWTQPWLGSSGLDTLTARAEGGRVVVDKTTDPTAARSHRIRVVGLDERGSQLFDQNITVRDARTEIGLPAGEARLLVADGFDETWAKARFSNWDDVEAVLPGIADPNTRIVVYNAVRDAVRDGELDPARALTLLLTALSTEPEPMTFAALLGFAGRELAGPFCPPEQRPWRRNLVAGLAASVLASSPAGSDHQLEAARALIRFDDTARWASWLEDAGVPDGLLVDVELRWLMLGALAELSGVDEATLAGELARDPSAAGQRQAAYIRAARPDEVSKARAWALVTEPSTASAYELYATAEGLFRPLQATPTRRYALAYFDAMASTAAHRRGWVLSKVISAGFPVLLSEPEVLAAAQATLARDDLAVPVRRALMDGTDELRRAVASITRFG